MQYWPRVGRLLACLGIALALLWADPGRGQNAADAPPASMASGAGLVFRDCSDCPQMVVVPAGQFTMGVHAVDGEPPTAEPPHPVTVERKFALGRFEITRAEYAEFERATRRDAAADCYIFDGAAGVPASEAWWRRPGFVQTPRDPLVCISWDDAQAYLVWLSERAGVTYRLPTEAEWEYAARAGMAETRYWGDAPIQACAYANVNDQLSQRFNAGFTWAAFPCADGFAQTAPVGTFRANPFGLFDMLGNVWEWVEDCWHETYDGAPAEARAWTEGGVCTTRVLRGGAWDVPPSAVSTAVRVMAPTFVRDNSIGLRVARDL